MTSLQELFNAIKKDESLLKGYASKKCSNCYGRGCVELKEKDSPFQKYMCPCVAKNIKKEFCSE